MGAQTVLMVEGPDDEHVIKHLCGARGLGNIDKVHQYGGRGPLLEGIGPRLKQSELAALGIILDADTDLLATWQAVSDRLLQAGYAVPPRPSADGTVIPGDVEALMPRIGIWIMPNNNVPGIIEDFLRFLVPEGDELFNYVQQSLTGIPPGLRRFGELRRPKALIHTWLAWQEEPGRPLGQAISARYLNPYLPSADDLAGWLTRTFFDGR